ncbi:hypothetical protein [Actinophytocola algeriensis]|uniref:Uncharacterized protein n=1 Tax=Actinophytocola algeriensis TaxID=1768010 RepID=A0A7W7VJR5_9PSEU|nr:hypothetical protein [Actinophytocola algeriensis]MBB4912927.1 hypothetical protein [Actinophytocola algeriensis]MBE1480926.1 hypothetical protein [Actinophytocola algeriensis]
MSGLDGLLDATAFAQWSAAFRLVECAAAVTLFAAATLGLLERAETDAASCHFGACPASVELLSIPVDQDG